MRILQIGPIPPEVGGKTIGGVATHVWDLSIHLVKRGHEVAILADNFSNSTEIPVIKDGVKIYGFSNVFILRYLPSILLNLSTISKLNNHFKGLINIKGIIKNFYYYNYVLRHFSPDVVHVHHIEFRFPFAYFASEGRISIVTSVHSLSSIKLSMPNQRQRYHDLIAENLKLCQNLILVSNSLKVECKQFFYSLKAKRIWIINNPIDREKYHLIDKDYARQRIVIPSKVPILLFVGALTKNKGIYTILDATKLLKEEGKELKVIIVGDGHEVDGVKYFVFESGLQSMVRLEGRKKYPDLLYYYNAADLFVMPSLSEGFSLAYIEALNCGTHIIGCKGVVDDLIQGGKCGLLVPQSNAIALKETIEEALDMKQTWSRKRISAFGRSFAWDTNIQKFEKVYKEVLNLNV